MKRLLFAAVCGTLVSGCLGDCTVGEATGILNSFNAGCSASGDFEGDTMSVELGIFAGAPAKNVYQTIEFSAKGPFYVGRHLTAPCSVSPLGTILLDGDPLPAAGFVDFIIDGADYSKSYERYLYITIVNLEARDLVTSKLGTFKGSVRLLKTGN